ncbi:MAG: hypothetical protein H0W20_12750 [Chthoniobacterales bacterium]|nr:hypothetical protein [Chthoniobacterales bacterium]
MSIKAKPSGTGKFGTGPLDPGSYVVEFRSSRLAGSKVSLTAAGGKKNVIADSVAGERFGGGGVAMKVDVAPSARITGQVIAGSLAAAQGAAAAAAPAGTEKVKANVKIINGKRYVWVPGPIGSNIRGRWVEEGSEAAALVTSNKKGEDTEALRKFLGTHDGGPATLKHRGDFEFNDQTGRDR